MPMVMNAHTIAAKTEAIWLREERVILYSFQVGLNLAISFAGSSRLCQSYSRERASFNKYNKINMMMYFCQYGRHYKTI